MASARKLAAVAVLSAAGMMMLSACGEPSARPMDDEFAGDSGEVAPEAGGKSCCDGAQESDGTAEPGDAATAAYADGDYVAIGQYGPVGEDTIDVYIGVQDGLVRSVRIAGHPFTSISQGHQEAFAKEVPGIVTGKPIADLKVGKVAGASWTSEAFNAALNEVRRQAADEASHQAD